MATSSSQAERFERFGLRRWAASAASTHAERIHGSSSWLTVRKRAARAAFSAPADVPVMT